MQYISGILRIIASIFFTKKIKTKGFQEHITFEGTALKEHGSF